MNPDGINLVSSGTDSTLKIWDILTGEVKHSTTFAGWYPTIFSVNIDGLLSSACSDGSLRIWSNGITRSPRSFSIRNGGSTCLAFVPRSKELILIGGRDGLIRLVNLNNGQSNVLLDTGLSLTNTLVKGLLGRSTNTASGLSHSGPVRLMAISQDSGSLISAGEGNSLKLWDLNSFRLREKLDGHKSPPLCVAINSNGDNALSGDSDHKLLLWNLKSGVMQSELVGHGEAVTSVCFSENGKYALSGDSSGSLILWDIATGEQIRSMEGHTSRVNSAIFTPDNRWAISCSRDETIRIWKLWDDIIDAKD